MNDSHASIERGLALYRALVDEVPALSAEFRASRAEFGIGPRVPGSDADEPVEHGPTSDRRHLEWFLFERPSEHLEGTPTEVLREAWEERAEPGDRDLAEAFLGSRAGIYEVTGVTVGEGVWLRDLLALGEYPLEEPEASKGLEVGDLVVGRLFPLGNQSYGVSPAAGCFRGEGLREALTRDLEAARNARRGTPRISQRELEPMFFTGASGMGGHATGAFDAPSAPIPGAPAPEEVIAAARGWLEATGLSPERARAMVAALVASPLSPDQTLPGAGDPLGLALEELAFDSDVDLAEARRVLLAAWTAAAESSGRAPTGRASEAADTTARSEPVGPLERPARRPAKPERKRTADDPDPVAGALAEFDRGRAEGADLDTLFARLEESLGLDPDEELPLTADLDPTVVAEPEATEGDPVPDFPDVVAAMVEEFLWETEREGGADPRLGVLRLLGTFAQRVPGLGVFENLTARDLLLFLTAWVVERGAVRSAAEARALVDAAGAFCAWADANHELALCADFEAAAEGLRDSLPRVAEANTALRATARGAESPTPDEGELIPRLDGDLVGEVALQDGEVVARVRDQERRLEVPLPVLSHLKGGELVRLRELAGAWEADRFFPAEAAEFLRR